MRTFFPCITMLLFLMTSTAVASDNWSHLDVAREAAYQIVTVIDWGQTLDISNRNFVELNPILGRHPSRARVNTYFPIGMMLHALTSHVLPSEYRKWWQTVSLSIESSVVVSNFNVGIRFGY